MNRRNDEERERIERLEKRIVTHLTAIKEYEDEVEALGKRRMQRIAEEKEIEAYWVEHPELMRIAGWEDLLVTAECIAEGWVSAAVGTEVRVGKVMKMGDEWGAIVQMGWALIEGQIWKPMVIVSGMRKAYLQRDRDRLDEEAQQS